MERRDALKLLAATATLPLLSRDVFAMFRAVHGQLSDAASLKILNPHQNATLATMAELIIPQTDTPGAKAVRVNEFIDLVVAEWYGDEEKSIFLTGLADIDTRTQNQFGANFIDCSNKQQMRVLMALDQALYEGRAASLRHHNRTEKPERNFFYMLKQLTLVGYYTSEAGFEQELHQEIIPSRRGGCVPLEAEK
jgi:glucoside 3-dehydrogenase (cytochrome c) hitch-hiker subunit